MPVGPFRLFDELVSCVLLDISCPVGRRRNAHPDSQHFARLASCDPDHTRIWNSVQ